MMSLNMNKIMEKTPSNKVNQSIKGALLKLKKKTPPKEGVDLTSIAKKLSAKKFKK